MKVAVSEQMQHATMIMVFFRLPVQLEHLKQENENSL